MTAAHCVAMDPEPALYTVQLGSTAIYGDSHNIQKVSVIEILFEVIFISFTFRYSLISVSSLGIHLLAFIEVAIIFS